MSWTDLPIPHGALVLVTWLDAGYDPASQNRETASTHDILLTRTPGWLQGVEARGGERFVVLNHDRAGVQGTGVYLIPVALVRKIEPLLVGSRGSLTAKDISGSPAPAALATRAPKRTSSSSKHASRRR